MPLQILGKKSWNVYNSDNVARVRKDEAAAQAQEEELEKRWREDDANRRLLMLRGQELPPTTEDDAHAVSVPSRDRKEIRRDRKRAGEDDTDRDIRLAKEDAKPFSEDTRHHLKRKADSLSGEASQTRLDDKHTAENEVELHGMRFKDAAGFRQGDKTPWYTSTNPGIHLQQETVSRDVWGNEDPRRREREQQRISSNDPLLAMKRGIKRLRENEQEKKEWIEQRRKDMYEVEQLAREEKRKRRRRRRSDEDDLDEFNLDEVHKSRHDRHDTEQKPHSKHRRSRYHRHRHRSASPHEGRSQSVVAKERREAH